ncbi:MAG: hypothetical protein ACLP6E_10290 [Acidimicrobiales bacterium]
MTSVEGPDGATPYGEADDAPGWGLPSQAPEVAPPIGGADDDAPLTPVQQAVVSEVAEGQRALGHEMRWRRRADVDLWEGGAGASVIDSALASRSARQVDDSEREAQLLSGMRDPIANAEPHFPAGGPPTQEEVHEAEMNPWPHHGMAETIEHNRQLRQEGSGDSG